MHPALKCVIVIAIGLLLNAFVDNITGAHDVLSHLTWWQDALHFTIIFATGFIAGQMRAK